MRITQLLRILCRALLVSAILATTSNSAALRSVADTPKPAEEAAYQKLIEAASAVVGVKVKALANARSNDTLGQERTGSGVLIGKDGLVLTIGYLILEADQVEVTDAEGQTVPGAVVAYDHATGFGLVRPIGKLAPKPIRLGTAAPVSQLDRLMIVTGGSEQAVSIATVVSKRRFAGYWEYLIDDAIFTSPPRLDHSGAALINKDGELVGIGSLFVMDALTPGERLPGNMFVPVDLLKPILDELVKTGGQRESRRPWLGVNSLEEDGRVKVMQVNEESPAAHAGLEAGDIILSVDGQPVESLEKFYRAVWNRGEAGAELRIKVLHGVQTKEVTVRSIDRREFMRKKPGI
ncbi:MAG TPA: S1C family serine protease [Usitatibacter sp.]|nr:S1C family serine protease [Usitatibacter sp.]